MTIDVPATVSVLLTAVTPLQYTASSQAHLTTYNARAAAADAAGAAEHFERDDPWYTLGGFLKNHYIPALKRKDVRVSIFSFDLKERGVTDTFHR